MSVQIIVNTEGDFSNEELKTLLKCIRDIEQSDKSRVVKIVIQAPDKTIKEMQEIINSVDPKFPYQLFMKKE